MAWEREEVEIIKNQGVKTSPRHETGDREKRENHAEAE